MRRYSVDREMTWKNHCVVRQVIFRRLNVFESQESIKDASSRRIDFSCDVDSRGCGETRRDRSAASIEESMPFIRHSL